MWACASIWVWHLITWQLVDDNKSANVIISGSLSQPPSHTPSTTSKHDSNIFVMSTGSSQSQEVPSDLLNPVTSPPTNPELVTSSSPLMNPQLPTSVPEQVTSVPAIPKRINSVPTPEGVTSDPTEPERATSDPLDSEGGYSIAKRNEPKKMSKKEKRFHLSKDDGKYAELNPINPHEAKKEFGHTLRLNPVGPAFGGRGSQEEGQVMMSHTTSSVPGPEECECPTIYALSYCVPCPIVSSLSYCICPILICNVSYYVSYYVSYCILSYYVSYCTLSYYSPVLLQLTIQVTTWGHIMFWKWETLMMSPRPLLEWNQDQQNENRLSLWLERVDISC